MLSLVLKGTLAVRKLIHVHLALADVVLVALEAAHKHLHVRLARVLLNLLLLHGSCHWLRVLLGWGLLGVLLGWGLLCILLGWGLLVTAGSASHHRMNCSRGNGTTNAHSSAGRHGTAEAGHHAASGASHAAHTRLLGCTTVIMMVNFLSGCRRRGSRTRWWGGWTHWC